MHDQRKRKVKAVVDVLVEVITVVLVRWKCGMCRKTFTLYPEFLQPYKHYAWPQVLELSERYVSKPISYHEACKEGELLLGHADGKRFFAETTLWRWVGYLGGLENKVKIGLDLLRQKCPQTEIFRKIAPVLPGKYRSAERKGALETASRVLELAKEYPKIFGRSFFPQFAMRC